MDKILINDSWQVSYSYGTNDMQKGKLTNVNLPHDMSILLPRNENVESTHKKGYFQNCNCEYKKTIFVPLDYVNKTVEIEFEGAYMNAMVYVNSQFAGQCPYGYSNFYVNTDNFFEYGAENEIKVIVSSGQDSRWYTGTGLYRNVYMYVANFVHFAIDGIKINTPEIEKDLAVLSIDSEVKNLDYKTKDGIVITEIFDDTEHIVATEKSKITLLQGTTKTTQRIFIQNPLLWNIDTPILYKCRSTLLIDGKTFDCTENTFGIRKLQLDNIHGLRINGVEVKLIGACIHHDNGILGSKTFYDAEERRVKKLKSAGFNSIRSAHYPMSKSMLDACDKLGMLVMDETFDMWTNPKSANDYANYFQNWWELDVTNMVNKDYNRPSVIMYSIGNEIQETGKKIGTQYGRKIAQKIKELDKNRYVTNSISGLIATHDRFVELKAEFLEKRGKEYEINTFMEELGKLYKDVVKHEYVADAIDESYSFLDIAGYNYMDSRYDMDSKEYPNRIICGTETYPIDIAYNLEYMKKYKHIIGDYTWTGWDYLGEAGIGKNVYDDQNDTTNYANYPWDRAYCGDFDIIGHRTPQSYYREISLGLREKPYIAVYNPKFYGKTPFKTKWSWSDTISSWTFDEYENMPIEIEVYSDKEEIELYINDKLIERKTVGENKKHIVKFDTIYNSGEVKAVSYSNNVKTGEMIVKTAKKDVCINVNIDKKDLQFDKMELSHLEITLKDEDGILQTFYDRELTIEVLGNGVLQGFGSGNPRSDEQLFDNKHKTFNGKALAIISSKKEKGEIKVRISGENLKDKIVLLTSI